MLIHLTKKNKHHSRGIVYSTELKNPFKLTLAPSFHHHFELFIKVDYHPCKVNMQDSRGIGQLQPHPQFFFKKVDIFIPLEGYTYVMNACSFLNVHS